MRQGKVYNNTILAGFISELPNGTFVFEYEDTYFANEELPAISIHFQKVKKQYTSSTLFPFFYNLISEGSNKKIQSIQLKIDEEDAFGFLLKTSAHETIGAIRVEEIIE
jgi:HipA-like protein